MATRPLLIFPQPRTAARNTKGGRGTDIHFPAHLRQTRLLGPKFRQLTHALEAQRAELRLEPGQEPERVLVLETVDGVDEFIRAVKRIHGMEWLGEWEEEAIEPDDDFYDEARPDRPLRGRLYLLMFNQQALTQLLSLWNRYRRDPAEKFETGLNKWRNVFARLRDIRFWDATDRWDHRLLDVWREQLATARERVTFKAELWFSSSANKRIENQRVVERVLAAEGGRMLGQSIIPEIAFHSIAGELPAQAALRVIDLEQTRLVNCNQVMFFPTPWSEH